MLRNQLNHSRPLRDRRGHVAALLAACVVAAAGGGCVPQQARDHARLLAALTERVKTDGERFAEFRQELNRARQQNIDNLEASTVRAEQVARHHLDVWRITDSGDEARMYTQIHDASQGYAAALEEVAALRQRQAEDLASLRSAVNIRSDKLAAAAQALGQLAEVPDFQSQVQFFIAYGKAVNDDLKEAQEEAAKATEAGKKEAAAQEEAVRRDTARDTQRARDVLALPPDR